MRVSIKNIHSDAKVGDLERLTATFQRHFQKPCLRDSWDLCLNAVDNRRRIKYEGKEVDKIS